MSDTSIEAEIEDIQQLADAIMGRLGAGEYTVCLFDGDWLIESTILPHLEPWPWPHDRAADMLAAWHGSTGQLAVD